MVVNIEIKGHIVIFTPQQMEAEPRAGQYVGIYRTGAISLKYQDAISKTAEQNRLPRYRNIANVAIFSE